MLSNQHFYHRIIRKMVVGFGTLFNNIKLYRYAADGTTEIERVNVPLSYAAKEKFYARITQDPTLGKETEITLPRMSFEMTSLTYDPLRKISTFNQQFFPNPDGNLITRMPLSPYNFNFDLNIYVRNTEDGTQIVEQILPYFAPDYTITADISNLVDLKTDIPIILNSINYDQNYTGEADQLRVLIWSLNFTAKGYLYGPLNEESIIRKASANTFNADYYESGNRLITLGSGSGDFKIGEVAYQGQSLYTANSTGIVGAWDNVAKQVLLTDIKGTLKANDQLIGAVTNSSYTITSFSVTDNQLTNLTITPTPNNANVNTAFGFIQTLEEYPSIT